jgi:hypothetical protein
MSIKKQAHPIEETEIPIVGIVRAGKSLEHPIFGVGEIIEIAKWESGEITIGINFKRYGLKWLVPEYANLKELKPAAKKLGILFRFFGSKK